MTTPPDVPQLITTGQLARMTSVPAATWRKWRSEGRADIPRAYVLGSRRLAWNLPEVLTWLESRRDAA